MLLEATNVSKMFGEFRAVAGADLAVDEGEIIGLIGPNGAGKSTFFNCLAGETMPTTGQIVFDGADVTRASPEVRARAGIGRTFQVPTTFEDMSVLAQCDGRRVPAPSASQRCARPGAAASSN